MSRPTARTALANAPLPDPRLVAALRQVLFAGIALVLVIPAARGHSQWFGAWPLWLVAMPAMSLWALHRFPMPGLRGRVAGVPAASRVAGSSAAARRAIAGRVEACARGVFVGSVMSWRRVENGPST
jgi:hypothetical protein